MQETQGQMGLKGLGWGGGWWDRKLGMGRVSKGSQED